MSMTPPDWTAYEFGFYAARTQSGEKNPYPPESRKGKSWESGYKAGEHRRIIEGRTTK